MYAPGCGGGMVCVLGGCLPLAGELPLLPVADALGGLSRLENGRLLDGALGRVPRYVRTEIARLLPQLEAGDPGRGGVEGWQRERLFLAVAELPGAVAQESGLVVVVEDVHWADSATLDCLTYLARAAGADSVTLVVTCRTDEVPLDAQLAGWLAHVRSGGVEEIRLGPCRGARPRGRSPRWSAGNRRAGLLMTCLPGLKVTRFSLSSWWPRRWPARRMCCARRVCCRNGWPSC